MIAITINDYYNSLTGAAKKQFRKDVCETCDISYVSFSVKRRNDGFSKLETEAINRLIKSKDYEKG